eukprot:89580-Rhodomonas_salina.1
MSGNMNSLVLFGLVVRVRCCEMRRRKGGWGGALEQDVPKFLKDVAVFNDAAPASHDVCGHLLEAQHQTQRDRRLRTVTMMMTEARCQDDACSRSAVGTSLSVCCGLGMLDVECLGGW